MYFIGITFKVNSRVCQPVRGPGKAIIPLVNLFDGRYEEQRPSGGELTFLGSQLGVARRRGYMVAQ